MGIKKTIKKSFVRVKITINNLFRRPYTKKLRKYFTNTSLSVFASNCVGGCMLHDLGQRFNSPFVNLFLDAKDYLKFLSNPDAYVNAEFKEIESEYKFPVALWGDLTIYFVHYKTFDEAVSTFKKRLARVNYDNLFVIFSEKDGCTHQDLLFFDNLPYKNKVVFTHRPYADIKSSFYITGFEQEDCLGDILSWDKKLGRKIYDRFDFANWLNG